MEKKYLTIKEAGEKLGVSKLTLRNWDKAGKLTAMRHPMNNYRVYLAEDLEKLIQKMTSGERPERLKKVPKPPQEDKPKFYKLKVIHSE